MASLSPIFYTMWRDPRLLKLPPYLSALCSIIGVVWLLLLPLNEYSRHTYISENALLPGQVHTYFGGSEENIFRAYRNEVQTLPNNDSELVAGRLRDMFDSAGLKAAQQKYEYRSSGRSISGHNVYSILRAPRGDATEAVVLLAALTNMDGDLNETGVALLLTLARYFKRWSLWSKDIILLITSDSLAGPQAWVDAYHDAHGSRSIDPLPLRSGALQGAIAIDFPFSHHFNSMHVVYDGVNGQLPNLDLINTAVSIASGQMNIGVTLQQMWKHDDGYRDRLQTILRSMVKQGVGLASGPHSSFIPYHVDAITLQAVGEGWHDEMSMGRTVESIFRSLNNLLEHFHQSFFFYLLMQANRFVSIGTYLPSAMLVAANFTIMALALWVESGRSPVQNIASTESKAKTSVKNHAKTEVIKNDKDVAIASFPVPAIVERKLFLPVIFVLSVHFLGLIPLYLFNLGSQSMLLPTLVIFTALNAVVPYVASYSLVKYLSPTEQQYTIIKSLSLLLLGMFLSALATLNFSQAFMVGVLSTPFSFLRHGKQQQTFALLASLFTQFLAPTAVLVGSSFYWHLGIREVLMKAAFGWQVWGVWTQVVVWCVWWPAWLTTEVLLASSFMSSTV